MTRTLVVWGTWGMTSFTVIWGHYIVQVAFYPLIFPICRDMSMNYGKGGAHLPIIFFDILFGLPRGIHSTHRILKQLFVFKIPKMEANSTLDLTEGDSFLESHRFLCFCCGFIVKLSMRTKYSFEKK